MANKSYAKDKFIEAVSVLATHPDRIKDRLYHAYRRFHTIGPDMPEPFTSDYEWIVKELTNVQGEVMATLSDMTEEHAVEIARRILELEYRLGKG